LASSAQRADTFLSRLAGLLSRQKLDPDEALIISDCRCIHMLGMRFAIDAVFLNRQKQVVGLVGNIRPGRVSPYFWRAYYVLEGSVGMIAKSQTQEGDNLEFSD